jgi:hypothetical protein
VIADFVSGQSFAEFFDHADGLMSDHQSGFHRVLTAQNVQVRSANGGERDSDYRFTDAGARSRHFFDPDLVWSVKDIGSHCLHRRSSSLGANLFQSRAAQPAYRVGQLCLYGLF